MGGFLNKFFDYLSKVGPILLISFNIYIYHRLLESQKDVKEKVEALTLYLSMKNKQLTESKPDSLDFSGF
jgi:hypothetical protein